MSHEADDGTPKRRRSVVAGAAVAGAVIVAAAVTVPLMMAGGGGGRGNQGGGGPTNTHQAAAGPTTSRSTAPIDTSAGAAGSNDHGSTLATGPAGTTTPSTQAVSTPTTRPHINPAATTSPAVNSAAPNGFGHLITTLWVDAHPGGIRMSVADVASILPGSVFFAEQPAIGTYWAIARFVPSTLAQSGAGTTSGQALLAQFDSTAIFVKVRANPWAYLGDFTTTPCGQGVPSPVLSSWGMCGP
jgi:hypothetical protein